MRSVPRKSILALALAAATFTLLAGHHASADTGGTTGTSTGVSVAMSDFTIVFMKYDPGKKTWVDMTDTEKTYFFDRAHCECNNVGSDPEAPDYRGFVVISIRVTAATRLKISAALSTNSFSRGVGQLFAGDNTHGCLQPTNAYNLQEYCTNLVDPTTFDFGASFPLTAFSTQGRYDTQPIPVSAFFGAPATSTRTTCGKNNTCNNINICNSSQATTVLYLWAQTKAGSTPDFTEPSTGGTINVVGKPSMVPASLTVTGGNEALTVSWKWSDVDSPSTDPNFLGLQLFCERGPSYEVFPGRYGNAYQTAATVCGANAPATVSYGAFSNLDKRYLCSGLIPPSNSSYRIEGLQNDYYYGVGIAVVDKYYNVSPIKEDSIAWGKPIPTVDFYTEYKDQGGSAQGGYCSLAKHGARSGVGGLVIVAGLAAVLRRRRHSKKRRTKSAPLMLIVGAGLGAGLLSSGQARAQQVFHDSSFTEDRADEVWGGSPRQFAIEVRFGLYTPNIDSEFTGSKPQEYVFGTQRRPMWQLEFDWEILREFGTLSLGGLIGYYKENANACTKTGLQADGKCPPGDSKANPPTGRSGDNTGLRLIPLAVLLVYRLDEAAERWHVPLVPYGKIGLNYTIWTVTNGDGSVPYWGTTSRGQGGTAGWQAAIGLSLQLDFLDPAAARGFDADAGVNHTYAFFELAHIDGSGLYRKDVLRVGDNTWFAGLMFEF